MATSGSDTSTSSSPPSESSAVTLEILIIVVIIFFLVVVVVAIVVIVILLLLWKKKKSVSYNNTVYMEVRDVNASKDTTLNGKSVVYEDVDNKNPLHSSPSKDANRNLYEVINSKKPQYGKSTPSDAEVYAGGANYSSIDVDSNPDVYNTLSRGHAAENGDSNTTYAQLGDTTSYPAGSVVNSAPNANRDNSSGASPSHTYAAVKVNQRPAKPKCTTIVLESDETEEVPRLPEKNQELQQYLDMKVLDNSSDVGVENDIYTVPTSLTNRLSTLKESVLNAGSLSNNPLYLSIETEMGGSVTKTTITDNVYAEPGVSIAADTHEFPSMENIYESIYSEALQHSHFMQEPEDAENMNDLCPYSSIYTVPVITTTQEKALEITTDNIREELVLGSGNFGNVVLAKTVGLSNYDLKIGKSTDRTVSIPVAVKMLKDNAGESANKQFEKEYRFMFRLNHPNVIRLLGICTTETPFIMMEYMENGDLNQILQHQYYATVDDETIPGEGELTQKMLIHICTQIASAMNYLASNNFIHRDLATRNCLVGEDFHIKISDFGMSRSLYESHYYIIRGRVILPIRWMATECFCGKFSAKTDVWAFGITMWEIFMLAKEEPYNEMSDRDLVQDAIRGPKRLLLSCPEECPRNIYEIMKSCWSYEAGQRATFEQLHKKLSSLE